MCKNIYICLFIACVLSTQTQASPEFLRFEGSIYSGYSEPLYNWNEEAYDEQLGFSSRQSVFFDFLIDTDLNVASESDSEHRDYFAVTYLTGTIAGPNETYGRTTSFPEGILTWLMVDDSLSVGTGWGSLSNSYDQSIDTWSVGSLYMLMYNGYLFTDIGSLELTYRGSYPPPAFTPTPLPPALWLFFSGLSLLVFLKRRKE